MRLSNNNYSKNVLMMVKNTPKKTHRNNEYSYSQAGETINKAAHLLLARWSKGYEKAKNKERYLFKQLHILADYLDAVFNDYYLNRLYFEYVGGLAAGDKLEQTFIDMEKTRLSIVRALKSHSKKVPPDIRTQHVYDGHKKVKWKFLIRLFAAQHTAELLYKQYQRQRELNGKVVPELESITRTLPGITAMYIRQQLPKKK